MSTNVTLRNIILIFSQITRIESETRALTQSRFAGVNGLGNARLFFEKLS